MIRNLFIILIALIGLTADADTVVQPGDTLRFSVIGMPGLTREAMVGNDGSFASDLVAPVPAAWRNLTEIRDSLAALVAELTIKQADFSSETKFITIPSAQVRLSVVSRPPVAAVGDVAEPGTFPFHSGMTGRSLLAMAGGHSVGMSTSGMEEMQRARLETELGEIAYDHAEAVAEFWRVDAELAGNPEPDDPKSKIYVVAAVFDTFLAEKRRALAMRLSETAAQERHMASAFQQMQDQITLLSDQIGRYEATVNVTEEDLGRLQDLSSRGLAISSDLSDSYRIVTTASAQILDASAELNEARLRSSELEYRMDAERRERRLSLIEARAAAAREISIAERKIKTFSVLLAELGSDYVLPDLPGTSTPEVIIYRRGPSGETRLVARMDSVIEPGDVVEYTLSYKPPTKDTTGR